MSSPITEKDLYECYCCKQTVDYQMRDDKSGICIRCYRCGDCGCNCEEMDEEEQRCPCGLTLSDDDLALESGKCEGCTMKDKETDEDETTCDFCSKKMTDDELTGERCSGCEKWCCNTCDEDLCYLEGDVKEKFPLCSKCIHNS